MDMSDIYKIETNMRKADSVDDCLKGNETIIFKCGAECSNGILDRFASVLSRRRSRKCVLAVTNLRVICFSDGCAQFITPYHLRDVIVRNKNGGEAELEFRCADYDDYDVRPAFVNSPLRKIDFNSAAQAAEAAKKLIHK